MDNKEKTDVSKTQEELLTAPLPPIDDTETLEKILSTLKEVTAGEKPVKAEETAHPHDDSQAENTVTLLNTQDLKNLRNLLSSTKPEEPKDKHDEKPEETGENTKAEAVELQTLVDPVEAESIEEPSTRLSGPDPEDDQETIPEETSETITDDIDLSASEPETVQEETIETETPQDHTEDNSSNELSNTQESVVLTEPESTLDEQQEPAVDSALTESVDQDKTDRSSESLNVSTEDKKQNEDLSSEELLSNNEEVSESISASAESEEQDKDLSTVELLSSEEDVSESLSTPEEAQEKNEDHSTSGLTGSETAEDTSDSIEASKQEDQESSDAQEIPEFLPEAVEEPVLVAETEEETATESGPEEETVEEQDADQPLFILNEPLNADESEPMVEPEGQTFINTSQIDLSPDTFYTDKTESGHDGVLTADKPQKEKRSKKPLYIILGLLALALIGIYAFGVYYYQDKFLPNTFVGGFNMGNKTLEEAADILESASTDRTVTITGKDGVESKVLASDVGLTITETPDVANTFNEQNPFTWPVHLLANNGTVLETDSQLNEEALDQKIAALSVVSGDQVVKTENAHAVYDPEEKTFVIKDEVYGTEVNVPQLRQKVMDALINGEDKIDLKNENLYVEPVILSDNETLAQSLDKLNKSLDTVVTYNFQTAQEVLDKNTFATWLTTDDKGEVYFNPDNVTGYVKGLADAYDTIGKPVVFTTTYGEDLQYTELYKGWEINQPQEVEELKTIILAGTPVTREPVYSDTGKDRSLGNKISGTYLEISIANQTMWYYKDGELIVSTPVVTGDTTQGYGTSLGYFVLQNKETNVTLRGNNADGSSYASPVTFWLPFNGGIGVHDASWRGSYGGSIYRGNGSHGCVNTPYSAVRTIYNNITVGDPVVVY